MVVVNVRVWVHVIAMRVGVQRLILHYTGLLTVLHEFVRQAMLGLMYQLGDNKLMNWPNVQVVDYVIENWVLANVLITL